MDNITQHFTQQPALLVIAIVALILVVISIPYFMKQNKLYGSAFEFASKSRKRVTAISLAALVAVLAYGLTPYITPPTDDLAIVMGNTQNSPQPTLTGDIADAIEGTMLRHKGDPTTDMAESIKIISAVKNPKTINLDPFELKLEKISNNNSNAKRSATKNIKAIEEKLNTITPTDNGANYLEAILEASDNVGVGSSIIVIGSGLSDNGDLNFSKSNILINEENRLDVIQKIKDRYEHDRLEGFTVKFYGLGDTVVPQEPLSSIHKSIVREIYKDTIRGLGGEAEFITKTLTGNAVVTNYVVGTTDTGCGEIGLIFDDDNLKFVVNQATFTNSLAARDSLTSIKTAWDKYGSIIQKIQVDGYIAHYAGPDKLSQQRADAVKKVLIDFGIPAEKITATGKGFGPYKLDTQNRIVKVTISRNNEQCQN